LSARELRAAQQVRTMTRRYETDLSTDAFLHVEATTSRNQVAWLTLRYRRTESLLQQEAVLSFTDGIPALSPAGQSPGSFLAETEKATYEQVAVGNLAENLDQFQAEQAALTTDLANYDRELHADLVTERKVVSDRNAALALAASLQTMLSRARARVMALSSAPRASTGPPVGHGIVRAVAEQLRGAGTRLAGRSAGNPVTNATMQRGTTASSLASSVSATPPRVTTAAAPATATTTTAAPAITTITAPPTTLPPTTLPPTTLPPTTLPPTTLPPTTLPPTTLPPTTLPLPTPVTAPPTPATTAISTAAPATSGQAHPPPAGGVWLQLRECESGDNYQSDTGNGYYGAYQFSWQTWASLGYPGRPDLEPYWMQDQAAERLESQYGWGQWPTCSAALGL